MNKDLIFVRFYPAHGINLTTYFMIFFLSFDVGYFTEFIVDINHV